MHKEMMRRCLGSSWRKKIHLEKDLMACLNHPFLVNLSYAFQNTEFLVLVMDLVPAGDLSEFVLTKKRLTPEQTKTRARTGRPQARAREQRAPPGAARVKRG